MGLWRWVALVNGALALVFLVVGDAVRDVLKRAVAAGVGAVERRFAGSRWVRGRSLRRYRRTVGERLSSVPVPFQLPVDIPMRDVYIPLRAADQPEAAATTDPVDLAEAIAGRRRVLVLGPPGSGKSLFLRYLLWSSCLPDDHAEPTDRPERQQLAVLVPLSRLAEGDDVLREVTEAFARDGFPGASELARRELDRGNLLLLLDGLDEVGSQRRSDVARLIVDLAQRHPNVRFVVTCRTQVYGGVLDGVVDKTLHVQPFTDELVERFLRAWPAMSSPQAVDRLVNVLRHTPRVALLVRNPLLLTMLAYMYSSEYNESTGLLPHNRTQFYRDASELLLRRWQERHNRFRWMDKKVVLQHLALVNQDSRADRRGIGYEAVLAEIGNVLPRVNLDAAEAKDVLDEIVDRSGLLMRLDGGERYQFAHLTMQEYFAATELRDQPDEILRRFRADPEGWREPVKLWCGGEQDSTELIRGIAAIDKVLALQCLADATRVDEGDARRLIASMRPRLLAKSTDPDEADAIVDAFGLLASDPRPRGRAVFDDLVSRVSNQRAAAALAASSLPEAAEAIGRQAATRPGLFRHLERMGDVAVPTLSGLAEWPGRPLGLGDRPLVDLVGRAGGIHAWVKTARSASRRSVAGSISSRPADEWARGARLRATSSLGGIGTPRAAQALVPLLWRYRDDHIDWDYEVARRAAVQLAQLTALPLVEDALARTEQPVGVMEPGAETRLPWRRLWPKRSLPEQQRLLSVFTWCHAYLDDLADDDLQTIERELDQRLLLAVLLFRPDGTRRFTNDTVTTITGFGSQGRVGDRFRPWWLLLVRFLVENKRIDYPALTKTSVALVADNTTGFPGLVFVRADGGDVPIPMVDLLDRLGVGTRLVQRLQPEVVERMMNPQWSIEQWWRALPGYPPPHDRDRYFDPEW